jgi:hypothetical protein
LSWEGDVQASADAQPYSEVATPEQCNIPNDCLVEKMRASVGLPVPPRRREFPNPIDGSSAFNCREPKAFRVYLWNSAVETYIDVCALHAMAMAVHSIETEPRILRVTAWPGSQE